MECKKVKKKYDYTTSRHLVVFTGLIFFTQIMGELFSTRRGGYEWVMPTCGAAFILALIYAGALIFFNTKNGN